MTPRCLLNPWRFKKAFISQPYKSVAGNLIVLLSHPIYDKSSNYIGYIGGSIHLKKQSLFSDVLSRHFLMATLKLPSLVMMVM